MSNNMHSPADIHCAIHWTCPKDIRYCTYPLDIRWTKRCPVDIHPFQWMSIGRAIQRTSIGLVFCPRDVQRTRTIPDILWDVQWMSKGHAHLVVQWISCNGHLLDTYWISNGQTRSGSVGKPLDKNVRALRLVGHRRHVNIFGSLVNKHRCIPRGVRCSGANSHDVSVHVPPGCGWRTHWTAAGACPQCP